MMIIDKCFDLKTPFDFIDNSKQTDIIDNISEPILDESNTSKHLKKERNKKNIYECWCYSYIRNVNYLCNKTNA